ncbi:MAG: radical SAM family heme chaperone HemW [Alphaproteobacteria bacterium]
MVDQGRAAQADASLAPLPPESETAFGVYVHWPFCAAKCPYCDFNSHVRHQAIDQSRYVAAFGRELAASAARTSGRTVTSIFFGGGTPSLMAPEAVGAILAAIGRHWRVADTVEITLEANPSSVEAERFAGYRAAGVNRVSIGVQALNDADLKVLGRLHDVAAARAAVALAANIFDRFSYDLIYARPNQSLEAWEAELRNALEFAGSHLSLYQLTIEPGTPYFALHRAGKLVVPEPDRLADFDARTLEICKAHGLRRYEISNYARPGQESRHNITYWRYQDYVGVGPGAHGRFSEGETKVATSCEASPEDWLALVEDRGAGWVVDTALSLEECGDEYLLMGMRLAEGISLARYEALSGRTIDPARVAALVEHGMVVMAHDGRLRATPAGFAVLDSVIADLAA